MSKGTVPAVIKEQTDNNEKSVLDEIKFGPSMVAGAAVGIGLTLLFQKFIAPKIIDVK